MRESAGMLVGMRKHLSKHLVDVVFTPTSVRLCQQVSHRVGINDKSGGRAQAHGCESRQKSVFLIHLLVDHSGL